MRVLLAIGMAISAIFLALGAQAADPRVVVWVEGVDRDSLRVEIEHAIADVRSIGDAHAFVGALGRAGQRGPIGPALGDASKRAAAVDRLTRAAHDAGADEIVVVVATRGSKGGTHAHVFVVDAATGEMHEDDVDAKRGDGAVGSLARANLSKPKHEEAPAAPLAPAPSTPSPPSPPSLAPGDHDAASGAPAAARAPGYEIWSFAAGMEAGGRHLRYVDALTVGLRDYSLAAAPLAVVRGTLFPLATETTKVDVGMIGDYARAFGVGSSAAGVGSLGTTWWRFHLGGAVRVRLPSIVLMIGGAVGGETFDFRTSSIDTQTPSVAYRFVRGSADARIPLGDFAILAGAGYDAVVSAGAVADRFPHSSVGGVEATLGAAYRVTRAIELVASASYRRFYYAMHPVPGDALVAGGAIDELYGLQGSAAYAF